MRRWIELETSVRKPEIKVTSEQDEEISNSYLLWDCFVNWALTLERVEKSK